MHLLLVFCNKGSSWHFIPSPPCESACWLLGSPCRQTQGVISPGCEVVALGWFYGLGSRGQTPPEDGKDRTGFSLWSWGCEGSLMALGWSVLRQLLSPGLAWPGRLGNRFLLRGREGKKSSIAAKQPEESSSPAAPPARDQQPLQLFHASV